MRLVMTSRLQPGTILAMDVITGQHGAPLLRKGTKLTTTYCEALERAGVNAVYIDDPLSEGIKVVELLSQQTRRDATTALAEAFQAAPTIFSGKLKQLPAGLFGELERISQAIANDIADCKDAVFALADLASSDRYALQHSIDVTVLGLLIGQRHFNERGWIDYRGQRSFENIEARLAQLGFGLLLHDVGKLAIPADVLNKPATLDEDEWMLIRKHTLNGLELLPSTLISAVSKSVIRSHHERWDGNGYPEGKYGSDIHQFARIAAVCDVFDAVTSDRPYRSAAPTHVGVAIVLEGAGTAFDPEIVETFKQIVPPYPPGNEVILNDGRVGIVSDATLPRLDRPMVRVFEEADGSRVTPYEVSLLDDPKIVITADNSSAAAAPRQQYSWPSAAA